jgi:ectoine hydroxylase-related dioxygenase (phytanoyl-CoA dioxygenase family)
LRSPQENGTLYIIPYEGTSSHFEEKTSKNQILKHHEGRASQYQDRTTYQIQSESNIEDGKEIPILVSAGSLVLLSSKVLHRSSANNTSASRIAYMPQFSSHPVHKKESEQELVAFAISLQ